MQTSNRILDDLARVANGAVSTLAGIKGEIDALVRQRLERLLADAELVTRDEFGAVKEMAANARAEQERLAKRVAQLEAKLAKPPAKPTTKPAARSKSAGGSAGRSTGKPAGKPKAKA